MARQGACQPLLRLCWRRPRLAMSPASASCAHVMVVLFLYVLSYMLTTAAESQFYLDKVCRANFGYNASVCASLADGAHPQTVVDVQKYVTRFILYNNLIRQVLPLIPGFLLGMWTDRRGARLAITVAMVGKTVYFVGYSFNAAFFEHWSVEVVLATAALPRALAGYDVSLFMGVRSHLSKVSPPEKLSHVFATMEMVSNASGPVGLLLGSAIFSISGKNYTVIFVVSAIISAVGLLYCLLFVHNAPQDLGSKCIAKDVHSSSMNQAEDTKNSNGFAFIVILLAIIFFNSLMMEDMPLLYLYAQYKFHWRTEKFTIFQTLMYVGFVVWAGLTVPILTKVPSISDTCMLTTAVCMVIASRFCFALAENEHIIYVGSIPASFQILIYISIYSLVSRFTFSGNRGKFLAVFASMESATTIIASPLYSYVYTNTISSYPSSIFFVSILLQCVMLSLILALKCIRKDELQNTEIAVT